MERRVELAEAPEVVSIEITEPLPESGVVGSTYKIKGSVKIFDAIGAPPPGFMPRSGLRNGTSRRQLKKSAMSVASRCR